MTAGNAGGASTCADPIDAAILADYWVSALSSSEEEAVEEHLLACDECGNKLREVIAIAEGVRRLALEGSLRMVVSEAFLKRAAADGARIRQYSVPAGGSVECTVKPADDMLIARLAADLTGGTRVDLSICDEQGVEQLRLPDIPVDSRSGSVAYQESITFAKTLPDTVIVARLVAHDDAGGERLLGEYCFNHRADSSASPQ